MSGLKASLDGWGPQNPQGAMKGAAFDDIFNHTHTSSSSSSFSPTDSIIIPQSVGDFYEFEEILGEGNTSQVVLGVHLTTKSKVAIKIIDKERLENNELNRERLEREIAILRRCNHNNIVKLEAVYESDLEVSLVMELMTGGDLFERVVGVPGFPSVGVLPEFTARVSMKSLFLAVDYLHDRGIVHRDLKPENLLYPTKESSELKLADFGLSKYSTETDGLETPCGTLAYSAPEITNGRVYKKSVDMWSCGCILYFMLFGRPPFYSENEEEMFEKVSRGGWSFPTHPISVVSPIAKDLIQRLLEPNPDKRYTAKQALTHPWITGHNPIFPHLPSSGLLSSEPISPPHPHLSFNVLLQNVDIEKDKPGNVAPSSQPISTPDRGLLRSSLNFVIDAQRGPLTPPLGNPFESSLWKKRMGKAAQMGVNNNFSSENFMEGIGFRSELVTKNETEKFQSAEEGGEDEDIDIDIEG
eukprot:TRINITY_DN391_c0_g1_i1.p1 TRINITY_DN391_c0_g1~~TRINITY_DN391_c0_g1_i1.p1  ORF type:complete len:470 (+),score=87.17 TRINITY_DN391_c0_g1_i1:161-1570(+)